MNMSTKAKVAVTFAAVMCAVTVFYWSSLYRLYTAVTLYDEDKIVHNFLSMRDAFNTTTIAPAAKPFVFPTAYRPLPESFSVAGKTESVSGFLKDSGTTGLMVIKDGEIVAEQYFQGMQADNQHISFSVAKSFVSALIGIAVQEGWIASLQDPVTDYVPELIGTGYDKVKIEDILQMSSGVKFNEDYGDFHSDINRFSRAIAFGTSLDDFTASLQREREPGTYHHYVSIDTQALGMLLTRVSGKSLTQLISERLWQPLGMQDEAYWLSDDDGMELALGGLNVTLRDYAKFGWLYLNKGNWHGQQLVPQQWVEKSVTPDKPHLMPGKNNPASSSSDGYGYQWWIPIGAEDEFMARGIYHQFIYVDPDAATVIVKTSGNHRFTEPGHNWRDRHLAMFRAIVEHSK
ncbi:serine hydrolase domain-containing protein [Aestuariibacter salexigens]|uniref:serine hydrolase domain-containing protein n=1 Tax=Aestuariibacter salexigens TaxID=226010 RepID=UPI00047C006B|nr:serine hydrolase [Aestuariibacter salexigens]